jgi:hypothetical protein
MMLRALRQGHSEDVTEIDRRLTELAEKLRSHRGDAAVEAVLRQRIDALLDVRLRLDEHRATAAQW